MSHFTKKDIDCGLIPFDIYNLCGAIREAFCISYAIRKENVLYILVVSDLLLLKFDGNQLRFLGPDERSQAFLLNKAMFKARNILTANQGFLKSTPGIYLKKLGSHAEWVNLFNKSNTTKVLLTNYYLEELSNIHPIELHTQFLYIILDNQINFSLTNYENFIQNLKCLSDLRLLDVKDVFSIAHKILLVNYMLDES
jgi:tRNA pseudouridine-54 N-methylase